MSAEAIVALLRNDISSSTASAVFSRNTNASIVSAYQVPPYLYMCLSDILQGTGKAASFPKLVNMLFGGTDAATTGIDVVYQSQESVFGNQNNDKGDLPGDEFGVTRILCRIENPTTLASPPTGVTSWIEQADLRVRYLIDCLYRQKWSRNAPPISVGGVGGTIDTTALDISLDPSVGLYCRWKQYDDTPNKEGDVRSRSSLFGINYRRLII